MWIWFKVTFSLFYTKAANEYGKGYKSDKDSGAECSSHCFSLYLTEMWPVFNFATQLSNIQLNSQDPSSRLLVVPKLGQTLSVLVL